MKALPIGEARRRLPALVRQVVENNRSVAIGRGGRPEAMLVPVGSLPAIARRPLKGLVEIVGTDQELERAQRKLRRDIQTSLRRTAQLITAPTGRRRA